MNEDNPRPVLFCELVSELSFWGGIAGLVAVFCAKGAWSWIGFGAMLFGMIWFLWHSKCKRCFPHAT